MPFLPNNASIITQLNDLPTDLTIATDGIVGLASDLMTLANRNRSPEEHRNYAMTRQLVQSPANKRWAATVTDILFRTADATKTRQALSRITKAVGIPTFLPKFHQIGLQLLDLAPAFLTEFIVDQARAITRSHFRTVVLSQIPTQPGPIRNFNILGEAILGYTEANVKRAYYKHLLSHPNCDYISVKISSLVPQLSLLDFDQSVDTIAEPLRDLYRSAMAVSPHKTVTLDMEEYKDLLLTVGVFKKVLSEPEFWTYRGGIVLQAYLPASTSVLEALKEWAIHRYQNGGGKIRIRIVKGANRAMESVESEISGHPYPLYTDKKHTDAHFKTLILACCTPDSKDAIDLGIATHNCFDLTFGLWVQHHHHPNVMIEMLQGMADDWVRTLTSLNIPVLVYSPLADNRHYLHAVAYLIRRLDENTGPDHFLGVAHSVIPGDDNWNHMAYLFRASVSLMASLDTRSLRQNQYSAAVRPPISPTHSEFFTIPPGFQNSSDSDWTQHPVVARWRRQQSSPRVFPPIPHSDDLQIQTALQTATVAIETWRHAANRSQILFKVADLLETHRLELIHALSAEVHKTAIEADVEVSESIDFIRYYCQLAIDLTTGIGRPPLGKGPAVVCPPWNFPASIAIGAISANLAVGNPVIFKPAPEAVGVGWIVAQLFWNTGVPRDVFQFIPLNDDTQGQMLIQSPDISTVMLTGSTATGRLFLEWRPDLNLIAETGGKNTMIVSRLCDRDLAIKDIVQSAFGFSGQKCSATSLVILDGPLYDDPTFITHLKEAIESLPVGNESQLSTTIVPLIHAPNAALLQALTTIDPGEEWILTPRQIHDTLWTPGVKRGVTPGSFSYITEFFGPVLAISRAESITDAISMANQTPYGLTAGIHSLDPEEIARWTTSIQAGNLYVNRTTTGAIVGRQPFGGTKASSIGNGLKAGGPLYLTALTEPVTFNHRYYAAHLAQWIKKMTTRHTCSALSGQTNQYWLVPREGLMVVIHGSVSKDLAIIAAQVARLLTLQTVRVIDAAPHLLAKIQESCPTATGATLAEITDMMGHSNCRSLRWIGPLSPTVQTVAITHQVPIFAQPLGDHALWELPRWLREVSLSETTHRFGNIAMG